MRLRSRPTLQPVRFELSMVSMIDIVFLLLIFFLVTTSYIRPELRLASMVDTTSETPTLVPETDLEPATIDIIQKGSSFVFRMGQMETGDLAQIEQVLKTFRNRDGGAFVRAADAVPFDLPARAINTCHQLGFRPVTYLPLN